MSPTILSYIAGNDTSYQITFEPSDTIGSFHSLPRFSHHSDISALFSMDGDEQRDYTAGLVFIACTIMSFFTVWGLVLLLLKCLGPFTVGVFSGYPYQRDGCASRTGRGIFLFSSIMVTFFSILAISHGLTKVENTTDTIDATNQDIIKIQAEFKQLITVLTFQAQNALPIRDQLVSFLEDDICPLIPNGNSGLRQVGQQTLSSLTELENFLADDLQKVDHALRQVARANKEIDTAVGNIEFTTGAIVGIMIPFFIIPSLLVVCLLLGWTETYYDAFFTFTEWLIMPFFIVMVVFAFAASGFIVMAMEGNADFCAGGYTPSPESTILNILGRYNLNEGELYYDAIKFYSHQCSVVDSPFGFLENYYDDLITVKATLNSMETTIMGATPASLTLECGSDYSVTLELVLKLEAYIEILGDAAKRSMELLSCSSIVPLYTNSVYKGICDENMTAALWLFCCSLLISFFGMVMVTLRGACYPLLIWDDDDDDVDEKDVYSTESSMAELELDETDTADDDGKKEEGVEFSFIDIKGVVAAAESDEYYADSPR